MIALYSMFFDKSFECLVMFQYNFNFIPKPDDEEHYLLIQLKWKHEIALLVFSSMISHLPKGMMDTWVQQLSIFGYKENNLKTV